MVERGVRTWRFGGSFACVAEKDAFLHPGYAGAKRPKERCLYGNAVMTLIGLIHYIFAFVCVSNLPRPSSGRDRWGM